MTNRSFGFLAELMRHWLPGARTAEIAEALELIGQELRRRGVTLRWETDHPLT